MLLEFCSGGMALISATKTLMDRQRMSERIVVMHSSLYRWHLNVWTVTLQSSEIRQTSVSELKKA